MFSDRRRKTLLLLYISAYLYNVRLRQFFQVAEISGEDLPDILTESFIYCFSSRVGERFNSPRIVLMPVTASIIRDICLFGISFPGQMPWILRSDDALSMMGLVCHISSVT